jgi:hypothetical protein
LDQNTKQYNQTDSLYYVGTETLARPTRSKDILKGLHRTHPQTCSVARQERCHTQTTEQDYRVAFAREWAFSFIETK